MTHTRLTPFFASFPRFSPVKWLIAATVLCTASLSIAQNHVDKPATSTLPSTSSTTIQKGKKMVEITTNFGVITIELYADKAPKTVANFLNYVNAGHYNGTIFHRVISNFMIQGGGFTAKMEQKPAPNRVENEANNGLKNDQYTLAMARTSDPHSASAQFFINVKNNDFLNFSSPTAQGWGYAVFGKVTGGTDVVEKIKAVRTGNSGMHGDVPLEPVVIEKAVVLK